MELPKTLIIGEYFPDNLKVSLNDSTRVIDKEIEAKLESFWIEKKKRADENGQICYNGTSYRLNLIATEDNCINLNFGTLEYKVRSSFKDIINLSEIIEDLYPKGCYSGATVKTKDDNYLMVELSGKSMNPNKVDLLGGLMETNLKMENGEDIFNSLYMELEEEACLRKKDIKEKYLRSIYLDTYGNVGFYFEVSLDLSSEILLERFKSESKDVDIKNLKCLSKDEYIEVLKNHMSKDKNKILEFLSI